MSYVPRRASGSYAKPDPIGNHDNPRPALTETEMASVTRWLKSHGFSENPFAEQEADRERRLPEYFVDTPFYEDILGSASAPHSMVISAGRGCGKSAHRVMVARACRPHDPDSSILAVEYTSFGWLGEAIEHGLREPLLRHHLRFLLEATVEALVHLLVHDDALAQRVPIAQLGRLRWFWQTYGVTADQPSVYYQQLVHAGLHLPFFRNFTSWPEFAGAWQTGRLTTHLQTTPAWELPRVRLLGQLIDAPPEAIRTERMPANVLYRQLVELAQAAGLDAVYVLVDRTDEPHTLAAYPERVAEMLGPLLAELPLIEVPGVAFKFFLPAEVVSALATFPGVRQDRVLFRELRWSAQALGEVLTQRLSVFSEGRITSIGQLCHSDLASRIETDLLELARGVPRTLLRICESLVLVHCQHHANELLFTPQDWQIASRHFTDATPAGPPLLVLDPKTRSAVIGTRTHKLTDTHFRLLSLLARYPGQTVPSHLIDDQVALGFDALRTAVRRIRQQIEPDSQHPIYLITERGEGLRLQHVAPSRDPATDR